MQIDLETIVSDAIMGKMREHGDSHGSPPVMATRALLIVEMMHEDGKSYLHSICPNGTPIWHLIGMVEVAKSDWMQTASEDDEED